jgi:hypothetical protein
MGKKLKRQVLHHAYVKVGEPWPWPDLEPLHVESEKNGTAIHIWWVQWEEE